VKVFSNTTPFIALASIDQLQLMPQLFGRIYVLLELDRGEKQTLLLASKHTDSTVIIDERLGRNVAEYMGLQVTGTLGVLAKAKASGFIPSFYAAAQGMREQGIHYSDGLITRLAQHLGEINP